MGVNSSNLYQTMREYTRAAIRLLADLCPEGPPRVLVGFDEWKRGPDNIFRLEDRQEPFWVECVHTHRDRLHSLDEYHRLVSALRDIPHIAQQLDNLVGTALSASRIETDQVTDHILWRLPRMTGGLRFDEAQFNQLFDDFEADLRRTSFSHVVLAPLLGLKIESGPIQLAPHTEIDHMTDDEIGRCLRLALLPDPFGLARMAQVHSAAAVRVRYDLEKRIGSHDATQAEEAHKVVRAAIDRAMAVLDALCVFKDGRISIPGVIHFSDHWPLEGGTHFQFSNPGPMPWFNKYDLPPNEVEGFVAFWRRFQAATARGPLANAVRRFSYANIRDRDDDRLVDLMIAAESLFLTDAGTAQERGELRYRLALRAAFFIDSPEYSRRAIFKYMKRAYDARSTIVHGGGEPDHDLLKSPVDAPLSFPEFVKLTGDLLRAALKKAIDMVHATGTRFIEWEDLIIPP